MGAYGGFIRRFVANHFDVPRWLFTSGRKTEEMPSIVEKETCLELVLGLYGNQVTGKRAF